MKAFRICELFGLGKYEDADYYFARKRDAISFIAKRIKEMDDNDEADGYDGVMAKRLDNWHKTKQWLKLAPYYRLYLTEIRIR